MYDHFIYKGSFTPDELKNALLQLCSKAFYSCFFDGNEYGADKHSAYSGLVAVRFKEQDPPIDLTDKTWRFGYIAYDHKNKIEDLRSENFDGLHFADSFFFVPEFIFEIKKNNVVVHFSKEEHPEAEVRAFLEKEFNKLQEKKRMLVPPQLLPRISKSEYVLAVNTLKEHIRKGDIYEINFCMEFYAERCSIDPLAVYLKLNALSHSPFSAFCKFGDKYLLSSSPERFLQKKGNRLMTQPIKGTARRGKTKEEDALIIEQLRNDAKELSENVMIVDLVRNDLARIAKKGTVKVEELFGIYTFEQVHQMISTVSCEVDTDKDLEAIIRATFPMGSMTGAPKVSAMKLIERYESTRRGLYSGAIGYIKPDGDLDLSVVIRSIQYNASENYLSFMAGSAITVNSDPEKEYAECLLKAKAMFEALK